MAFGHRDAKEFDQPDLTHRGIRVGDVRLLSSARVIQVQRDITNAHGDRKCSYRRFSCSP